jgi:hypothetical protein
MLRPRRTGALILQEFREFLMRAEENRSRARNLLVFQAL